MRSGGLTKDVALQAPDSRMLRLLADAAARLLAASDSRAAVADLFQLISDELRLDAYFNYILGEDGRLHLASSAGLDAPTRTAGAALTLGSAVCGKVALEREPHYACDIQASSDPLVAFLKQAGLTCYACTPMLVGERLHGTLGFGRRSGAGFTDAELQFLRTVTHYAAMAFERLRTEHALRDSERRLNAVLDNASVAIFVMDDHQHCTYVNAAAETLTGYTLEEMRGRALPEVVQQTGRPGRFEGSSFGRALTQNDQARGEDTFVHKDGRLYQVAFTAGPIRDAMSGTVGAILEVRDITQEKRNEEARDLLMREVDHRARNALTIVQSIVQLTRGEDLATYRRNVLGRVGALGRAQGSLAEHRWEGASLRSVIDKELQDLAEPSKYALDGPEAALPPEQVQPVGMIFHELATNAVKYGALGTEAGFVTVRWRLTPEHLEIQWVEEGGPPVQPPTRHGFGSQLVRGLRKQLQAETTAEWAPGGVRFGLRLNR